MNELEDAHKEYLAGLLYIKMGYPDDGLNYLIDAANNGHLNAHYKLGKLYLKNKQYHLAEKWFRKSSKLDHIDSAIELGLMHKRSLGWCNDIFKANKIFINADPHPTAQYELGDSYRCGYGVKADKNVAYEWFQKSAEQGNADAQYELGIKYDYNKDFENKKTAMRWYKLAAEQGHIGATKNYDWMMENTDHQI